MRFLSLFSGIEAASAAFNPLGWEAVGFSEIEPFPCAVLAHHYPSVPNLGDVSKITREQVESLGPIDLVCGGFPCQDLSVAGKRVGLKDDDGNQTRSGLFFDAMRVVGWANHRWLLIENTPGMLSSNKGRDFAAVVGAMAGCEFGVPAYGWENCGAAAGPLGLVEWATLDAQFFGLAQRRKRVFLVRDSGDWASRAPVLLERESLLGHPAPSRQARQAVAGSLGAGSKRSGGRVGRREAAAGHLQAFEVANCLTARMHKGINSTVDEGQTPIITRALTGEGFDASEDGTGRGTPLVPVVAGTLRSRHNMNTCEDAMGGGLLPVAFDTTQITSKTPGVMTGMQVRRLTPRECERLQGFPDDYTLIPHRGKPAADGPRYRALGNSWAVPCAAWIGRRIAMVDAIEKAA